MTVVSQQTGVFFVGGMVYHDIKFPGRLNQQMYHYDPITNVWTLLYWQLPPMKFEEYVGREGSYYYYEPYLIYLARHEQFWIADLSILSHFHLKLSHSQRAIIDTDVTMPTLAHVAADIAPPSSSSSGSSISPLPSSSPSILQSSSFVPKYNETIMTNARTDGINVTIAWTRLNIDCIIDSPAYRNTIYYKGRHQLGDCLICDVIP
jgi:hypothetical protein